MPPPDFRRFGQIDFGSMVPFSGPLPGTAQVVVRLTPKGDNVLATVADISGGGGVDISALTGGADDDMLYRIAGVWTGTGATGLKYNGIFLQLPDGSAAQPSLAFAGSPTSGFFRSAADVISASIAGVARFKFLGDLFRSELGNGPGILNSAVTGAVTILPRHGDPNTGVATGGDDIFVAVAGGVNGIILVESSSGILQTNDSQVTLTAFAGGGQAGAAQINSSYAVITTVATAGDSVKLSQFLRVGTVVYIKNDGANACDVFPGAGDDLGLGVGVAFSLAAGKSVVFLGTVAGSLWTQLLGFSSSAFPEFQFSPLILENPNNADWAVNALAPAVADSIDSDLTVRLFDDTTEEGVGFGFIVPTGATNIVLNFQSRAEVAPPAVRTVGVNLYTRDAPDNGGVAAWSAGLQLTDVDIPNSNLFQVDTQTITLASLGITAGNFTHFELTRIAPSGGTNLVGDWDLLQVKVSFT